MKQIRLRRGYCHCKRWAQ